MVYMFVGGQKLRQLVRVVRTVFKSVLVGSTPAVVTARIVYRFAQLSYKQLGWVRPPV
jgi:hypothetical protein